MDNLERNRGDLRLGVHDLPFTLDEANKVHDVLTAGHINSRIFADLQASEGNLKRLSGNRVGLLHIATHGLFITDEDRSRYNDLGFLAATQHGTSYEDQMLSTTGLLLAGAGSTLRGAEIPENLDDGILTSAEISKLDFRGMELVVLSACETGTGSVFGEGVFGLQRGFKKAGAKSLLMSLWKVDDEATQLLMTEFYRLWIIEKKPKRIALHEAQQYLQTIDNGKFSAPRYWAAFILLDAIEAE